MPLVVVTFMDFVREPFSGARNRNVVFVRKKTGRKTDSPPGLKLGVMTANDFSRSLTALGANAFFSWLIFSWQLFFAFWPSAFPPFQSANAVGCVKIWSSMSFTYNERSNRHDFFVKHFSRSFANIFMSSRATFFFGAREILFISPPRKKIVTSFSSVSIPEFGSLT